MVNILFRRDVCKHQPWGCWPACVLRCVVWFRISSVSDFEFPTETLEHNAGHHPQEMGKSSMRKHKCVNRCVPKDSQSVARPFRFIHFFPSEQWIPALCKYNKNQMHRWSNADIFNGKKFEQFLNYSPHSWSENIVQYFFLHHISQYLQTFQRITAPQ